MSADVVVLSVRLESGGFDSSIKLPLDASAERRDACVAQWLDMMRGALAMAGADVRASANWPLEDSHDH